MKNITPAIVFLFLSTLAYGQLGFCTGSKGEPIFFETFGSGTTHGPALPAGVTSYTFHTGMPHDGEYAIYNNTNVSSSWHVSADHTPDALSDGTNGKMMIVNAGFTAGEFYRRQVSGLCVNTSFEFSAWLMNVYDADSGSCSGTGKPVDVTFEIWNQSETVLLASGVTGPIDGASEPLWTQYALAFTMPANQTSVVLKMKNNGVGGCGNDLAIDDISFRACGDIVTITSPPIVGSTYTSLCEDNNPVSITLVANATSTAPHIFQWQESVDNTIWNDIAGAVGTTYTTPGILSTRYYRTRLAQDAANLSNPYCSTLSDVFTVYFVPKPDAPVSNGDVVICSNEPVSPLSVTVGSNESVNWFSAPVGGLLLASDTTVFSPSAPGTFYAEAYTTQNCTSDTRTPVTLTINPAVVLGDDQTIHLCQGQAATLDAGVGGLSYIWTPGGETTPSITVSGSGLYTVTATEVNGCSDSMAFHVFTHIPPVITQVLTDESTVTIVAQGDPYYEYSLDGTNYQTEPVFYNVEGGWHTVYVRDPAQCGSDDAEFFLIYIPHFFTPNGDGFHDVFEIEGMTSIQDAHVYIFDRYGKLVALLTPEHPAWDGNYNGHPLPSSDYWYSAVLQERHEYRGHFSLKR
jgi:gliding motility-associated-like protein